MSSVKSQIAMGLKCVYISCGYVLSKGFLCVCARAFDLQMRSVMRVLMVIVGVLWCTMSLIRGLSLNAVIPCASKVILMS